MQLVPWLILALCGIFSPMLHAEILLNEQQLMEKILELPGSRPSNPFHSPLAKWAFIDLNTRTKEVNQLSRHHLIPWKTLVRSLNNVVFAHIDDKWHLACPVALEHIIRIGHTYRNQDYQEQFAVPPRASKANPAYHNIALEFLDEIKDGLIAAEKIIFIRENIRFIKTELGVLFSWLPFDLLVGPTCRANDPGNNFDRELLAFFPEEEQIELTRINHFLESIAEKPLVQQDKGSKFTRSEEQVFNATSKSFSYYKFSTKANKIKWYFDLQQACSDLTDILSLNIVDYYLGKKLFVRTTKPSDWISGAGTCVESEQTVPRKVPAANIKPQPLHPLAPLPIG